MKPSITGYRAILVIFLAGGLSTLAVLAGPALPGEGVVAESIQSMAEVKNLAISVAPMTELLAEAHVSVEALTEAMSETLTAAGFTVLEKQEERPRLVLQLMTGTDAAFPDAVSYCAVLALRQPVGLKRIEHEMEVATYVTYRVALENKENLRHSIFTSMRHMVAEFIWMQSWSKDTSTEGDELPPG